MHLVKMRLFRSFSVLNKGIYALAFLPPLLFCNRRLALLAPSLVPFSSIFGRLYCSSAKRFGFLYCPIQTENNLCTQHHMCCEENPPFDYWRFSSRESNQDGITEEGKKFDKNRLSKVYNWKKLLSWQICYMLRLLPSIFCLFVTTATPSTTSLFIGLFSDY